MKGADADVKRKEAVTRLVSATIPLLAALLALGGCAYPGGRARAPGEVTRPDAELVLASNGVSRASVVVDPGAGPKAARAAAVLRDTLAKMAGGEIPLVEGGETVPGPRLVVGPGAAAETLGVRVAQEAFPAGERYVIRRVGDDVVIAGNDAGSFEGTAMAVYHFLEELGCGWYGPDPLYHVMPRRDVISVAALDIDEQPDFAMRSAPGLVGMAPFVKIPWRLGDETVQTGHVLFSLVPEKLREQHPDWFGPGQPCLTHPGVQEHIVEQLRRRLDEAPGKFLALTIGQNDTDRFCECERCRAAGNPSARYLTFANNIADALRETHPGRFQLGFLAFWVTHSPPVPMVKARPEVSVLIVNEGDHTKPLDDPVSPDNAQRGRNNRREQTAIAGWLETGGLHGVYEWWIPGANSVPWRSVPWYSGETALRNLRYWQERGMRYLTYEIWYEHGNGFPLRWPLYYVFARGAWDTSLSADRIMTEATRKLFGRAWEQMFWFYRTLEMAMLHTPHPGGNWHLPSPELVYPPEIEARATAHLDKAAEMTDVPEERARIESERRMWNQARATLAQLRAAKDQGGFTVKIGEHAIAWSEPMIGAATLGDIAGLPTGPALPPGTVLEAVEGDGQSRVVTPADVFDLRTGITFRARKR